MKKLPDLFDNNRRWAREVEVEHVLRTHPHIRDVAVVGVPDARWGEVGKAFVVLEPGTGSSIR